MNTTTDFEKDKTYTHESLSEVGFKHYKDTNCAKVYKKDNKVYWFEKNKDKLKLLMSYEIGNDH